MGRPHTTRPKPGSIQAYKEKIEQVIRETEVLLDVAITIHDTTGIFKGPEGEWLLSYFRVSHQHPACVFLKSRNRDNCIAQCQQYINKECTERREPWVYWCWGGVGQVVIPVLRDDSHQFTLFVGAFRPDKRTLRKTPYLKDSRFKRHYAKMPVMTKAVARMLGNVVSLLGRGLLSYVDETTVLSPSVEGKRERIRRFLGFHAHEDITLKDLAGMLNLSLSRTSHLVTELFGMPFRTFLLRERIHRSRILLLSPNEWSVGEIARRVGIPDEYHFNRVFKKTFGLPPGKYRRKFRTPPEQRASGDKAADAIER